MSTTKITNKQVEIVSNVNFKNKEIVNSVIDANKNILLNLPSGEGNVDDVQVNGTSVVSNKVADIKLKTINGNDINGEGDIAIKTYQSFNSNWTVNSTTAQLCSDIDNDTNAVAGMAYLGILHNSDLPNNMIQADAVVEIIGESGGSKVIHITITSADQYPYRWEYSYFNEHSINGWIGFQPELISGTNIKTVNNESILGTGNLEIKSGSELNEFVITQEIFDEYKNENDYADLADIIDSEEITQNVINLNNFNYFLTGLEVSNKTLLFKNATIVLGTSGVNDSINNAITSSNCKLGFKDCEIIVNDSITTEPEKPIIDLNNTDLTFDNVIADNFTFTTFKTFIQTTNTCNIVLKDTLFDIIDKLINYDPEEDEKKPSMKFIKVLTNDSSVKFINSMVDISTEKLIDNINPGLCQNIIVETIGLVTVKLEILNSILQLRAEGGHGEGGISSRPPRCLDINLDNLDITLIDSLISCFGADGFNIRSESSYGLEPIKSFTTNDPYMVFFEPDIDIFQGDDEAEDYEPKFENINIDKYLFINTIEYIEGDYHFTYNGSGWDVTANSFDEDDTITRTLDTNITIEQIEEKYGLTFDLIEGKVLEQGDDITLELVLDSSYYKILKNFTAESNSEEYFNELNYNIGEVIDLAEEIETVNYDNEKFANALAEVLERNGKHLKPHREYDEEQDIETDVMAKIGFWYDEDNDDPNVWKIEIDSEWIEEDEHLMDDVDLRDFGLEVIIKDQQEIHNLSGFTVVVEPKVESTTVSIKENTNSVITGNPFEEDFPWLENKQPLRMFSTELVGFSQVKSIQAENIKTNNISVSDEYYLPVDNENLESNNVKDAINELADKGTLSEENAGFSISIHGEHGRSGDKIYYDGLDIEFDGWDVGEHRIFGPGNEMNFNETHMNVTEGSLIFRNGQLIDLDDYTIDNNVVTFNTELQEGDVVLLLNGWNIFKKITGIVGDELEIDFNFEQRVLVFKNGILLSQDNEEHKDYYFQDGKLIFTTALNEDDKLTFVRVNGFIQREDFGENAKDIIFTNNNNILIWRDGILQSQSYEDEEGQLPENYDYVSKDNPNYHEDRLINNVEFMNDDKIELESETTLTNQTDVNMDITNMFYADGWYYYVIGGWSGNISVQRADNVNGENLEDVVNLTEETGSSYYLGSSNVVKHNDNSYFIFTLINYMSDDYILIYDNDWNLLMKYHSGNNITPIMYETGGVLGKGDYENKIIIPTFVMDDVDNAIRLVIYDIEDRTYQVVTSIFDNADFNVISTKAAFYNNKIWMSTEKYIISVDLDNNYTVNKEQLINYTVQNFSDAGILYVSSEEIDEEIIESLYYVYSNPITDGSVFIIYKYNEDNGSWEQNYIDESDDGNKYLYTNSVEDYNGKIIISTGNNIYISRNLNDIEPLYQIINYGDLIINDNILSVKGTINYNGYSYFDMQTQVTEPITPVDENERIIFIAADEVVDYDAYMDKITIQIKKHTDEEDITIFSKKLDEFEDYEHEEELNILFYIQVKDLDINELLPEENYSFTLEGIYEDEEDEENEELFRIEFNTSLEDGNIIFNIEPYSINEPYMIQFQDALENCNLTILDKGISGGIFNTLSDKQDKLTEKQLNNINNPYKPLIFTNIEANDWYEDDTFEDYEYKCELECEGVNENMFAQVVFGIEEANSGNYASVCDTVENKVIIYSKVNDTITIPTIVIMEA